MSASSLLRPRGLLSVGLHLLAVLITVQAWAVTNGDADPEAQIPWVVLAGFAAAVSGAVNAAGLLKTRREIGLRHRLLSARVHDLHAIRRVAASVEANDCSESGLLAIPGGTRYHRAGCALVEKRVASAALLSEHELAGRRPCGWCKP